MAEPGFSDKTVLVKGLEGRSAQATATTEPNASGNEMRVYACIRERLWLGGHGRRTPSWPGPEG